MSLNRITNKICMSVVAYSHSFGDEEASITIEVGAVRNESYGESYYPRLHYWFNWDIEGDESELVVDLRLLWVSDEHPGCSEALPQGDIETLIRAYAENALRTMIFKSSVVEVSLSHAGPARGFSFSGVASATWPDVEIPEDVRLAGCMQESPCTAIQSRGGLEVPRRLLNHPGIAIRSEAAGRGRERLLWVAILVTSPTNHRKTIMNLLIVTSCNTDKVHFSIRDRESEGMVAFMSSIDVAHACFLSEHVIPYTDQGAYAKFIRHVAENGTEIDEGIEFWDEE